jgi:CheY-like chemotaxis protein
METFKTIHFLDDDEDDLHLLMEISQSLGHIPRLFRNGINMLTALRDEPIKPDIIFLDINMPTIDGYQILRNIRAFKEYNDIPIVIHSGNCDDKCINKCLEYGANYYMTKAFSYNELRNAISYATNKDWKIFRPNVQQFLHIHEVNQTE